MSEVATVLSLYKNNRLEDVWESLDSLYRQTKKTDIFIQLDGTVPKEIENFLDSQLDAGKIEYLGKRNINLGIAKSHNELFEIVLKRGYRYIARMDTDDIAVPDRIEQQYIFMEQNPDIDVVGGYIEEFSDDTSYKKVVKYPLNHDEMFKFFSKRVPIANPTTFFRKTFFEKAGLYPITSPSNEDTLMWMNGFHQGCVFANIANILVKMRVSGDFFERRGGFSKAYSDLKDRIRVIRTLRYNYGAYFYAIALFAVNIAPSRVKFFLYKRLR